jgi:chromosome partitioning protein
VSDVHGQRRVQRRVDVGDLVGIAEIAELADVSAAAVGNWRKRDPTFPEPIRELRAGPVFSVSAVQRWLHSRRKVLMSNRISTINLKGGVGKTTTTVAVAEMLAVEFDQKVLLVDLDPQTNLTTIMIGEELWKKRNEAHQTLAQLFKDALSEEEEPEFDLDDALLRGVSSVEEVARTGNIDLLPSSLNLIDIQDKLASMPAGRYYSRSPGEILHTALKQRLDDYDWVLIDCPPNLGLITLNGLRISQGYVIPTIPDILSTYGIPQIVSRVADFAREINEPIEPLGIIVSKYRDQANLHRTVVENLRNDPDLPEVFETVIPEAVAIAASAEFQEIGTLRQKYQHGGRYERYVNLTEEIMEAVGAEVAV